jgi:hypothetical protein
VSTDPGTVLGEFFQENDAATVPYPQVAQYIEFRLHGAGKRALIRPAPGLRLMRLDVYLA